jgi:tetratricopeptide (TPR) repeat protein
LTSAVSEVSRQRDQRLKLIAIAAIVGLLAVWVALRFNPGGVVATQPATVQAVAPPVVAPSQNQVTPAPAPHAGVVEPRSSRVPGPGPVAQRPKPDARVDHFALALRYQNQGDFEQAREHYLAVLAANAFNVEAHNNLGLLYHGRAMTDDAIDQFARAIQINPGYTKARSNLAVVLTGAGRLAEARTQLRAALAIDPDNPDLLVNMALVEKADQHAEQAIEILLRAIAASPVHAAAHYNLAVLYDERGSLALSLDHYNVFLRQAGPERAALLAEVQQRVRAIEPRLQGATN